MFLVVVVDPVQKWMSSGYASEKKPASCEPPVWKVLWKKIRRGEI